jgi:hypothetical protein
VKKAGIHSTMGFSGNGTANEDNRIWSGDQSRSPENPRRRLETSTGLEMRCWRGKCEAEVMRSTIIATGILFAVSAFAHQHTALNGTWTLVPAHSDFAGQPVIQTGTVTINERDGDITVSRSFKYEGVNDSFFYRDITDSQNSATIHTGKELKTKTRWDHDVLRVTNTNKQSGAVTRESYSLAPDGTMLDSVVGPEHTITLVFERK